MIASYQKICGVLLLSIVLLLYIFQPISVFAVSPSFVRQTYINRHLNQWVDLRKSLSNTTNGLPQNDMLAVSYVSDGRTLNAIFWLAGPFNKDLPYGNISKISYGMIIDVDFDKQPEYMVEIQKFRKDIAPSQWVKMYREFEPQVPFQHNIINNIYNIEPNYTNFYGNGEAYIRLSVDLGAIGYPSKYEVYFFTEERIGKINSTLDDSVLDQLTDWISIPPPDVNLYPTPNSQVVHVNEEKPVLVQVNSTTNSQPVVHLFAKNQTNITLKFDKSELQIPPSGVTATTLRIKALPGADVSSPELVIPIYANSTFSYQPLYTLPTPTSTSTGVAIPKNVQNRTMISNLRLSIEPEKSPMDRFLDIMSRYQVIYPFLPLSFVGGILLRHFTPWIKKNIKKLKRKKTT